MDLVQVPVAQETIDYQGKLDTSQSFTNLATSARMLIYAHGYSGLSKY